ncbi:MAG: hypothetical protein AMJ59_11360 [Gammaproteobacteria bacterium SG8_31]|jgi:hypothetical protein|nr:MAG: hypothetical protein AMJ59_11360 [Gammaproteobacteria bacterium SG8_31]
MAAEIPIIGDWYQKPNGVLFEVVAIDDTDSTVEIQYFDGTIAEVEMDAWLTSGFQPAEPPEDFSGSLDMENEDSGLETEVAGHQEWADPLDFLDRAE